VEIRRKTDTARPWGDSETVYEEIGGDEAVRRLSDAFYDAVEADSPTLRAMLPRDTSNSRQKLYEFLSGWMGGPQLYWERRGHPALRMRHAPFPIDTDVARQWSECMRTAIAACEIGEPLAGWLDQQLSDVAVMLRNRPD
jgi:hemoglobin